MTKTYDQLLAESEDLRARLEDAQAALDAIRTGQVDALVVGSGPKAKKVYTLEGAEHPYRAFVEAMQQGAVTLSPDGTIFYCNQRFAVLVRTPHERVIGAPFSDFLAGDSPVHFTRMLQDAHHSPGQAEVVLKAGDRLLPAYLHLSALPLPGGAAWSLIVTDLTERKEFEALVETERRLAESEARLQVTLSSIGDAVIATDGRGRVTFLNPVAESLTGWQGEEAAEAPLEQVFKVVDEHTRLPVEDPVTHVLREGQVVGLGNHTLLIARDGVERPIDDSAAPIKDAQGQVLGVVLVFRDVTEKRRSEQILRESEEQYRRLAEFQRTVMDHMGEGLYTVDAEGLTTYVNPAAERLLGWTSAELLGRKMHDVVHYQHPDGTPFPVEECAGFAVLRHGTVLRDFEDVFIRKDGSFFPVTYSSTPLSADGQTVGLVVVFRDVSERQKAQAERQQLAAIVESSEDAIVSKDLKGIVTSWNKGAERVFGYTAAEMVGRPIAILAAHDRRDEMSRVLERVKRGERIEHYDTKRRRKDGTEIAISLTVSPIKDSAGRIMGASKIARDVSERTRLHEALERRTAQLTESDRRKDEFLAMLAHELRNPLAPIRNAVQIIRLKGSAEPMVGQAREMIERQVDHLVRLVDDLLDVSRITRGKINLRREPVELAQIIAAAVESSRPLIDARFHELQVEAPAAALRVEGDLTRLSQVVSNLLTNSAKYTPEGGHIWLIVQEEKGLGVIRVRDDGVGIAPELLPKVFDLFTQAERTLDRSQGGLGIGLTLVKKLTEMHGGTVEAHSEGAGKGSEFVVRLPLQARTPTAPEGGGPSAEGLGRPAPPGRRILVVDDNKDSADSLALLLTLVGNQVRTAQDGETALKVAAECLPEVILLDIGLPGLDGYQVARRLRAQSEFGGTVLVAMTGYGTEGDRRRSEESGFYAHMVKPVEFSALQELLRTLTPR
jgi:PAS domain S-box-containing protein